MSCCYSTWSCNEHTLSLSNMGCNMAVSYQPRLIRGTLHKDPEQSALEGRCNVAETAPDEEHDDCSWLL